MKKFIALLLALVLALALFTGCGGSKKGITIASKQFTENILLAEMYAQLVEAKTDIPVTRKLNLGGTSVCLPAMQSGEIDVYFEYTGTAYNEILKLDMDPDMSSDELLSICKDKLNSELGFTFLDPVGLNNTFAVAIRADRKAELGVSTLSELGAVSGDLRFGANHVFYTRESDGYDSLIEVYGLNFKEALKMDTSLLYDAIDKDELDVMIVYATDALLKKYDMTILTDDKELFPPYHGAPMIRNEVLEKYPELAEVLNSIAGKIDDTLMQELNYQVDVENRAVEDVAKEFLTQNGYI